MPCVVPAYNNCPYEGTIVALLFQTGLNYISNLELWKPGPVSISHICTFSKKQSEHLYPRSVLNIYGHKYFTLC